MRRFSIPLFAILVIAALFWGNCLSCPQVLMTMKAHSCCHHIKIDCQAQGLTNFLKADAPDQGATTMPIAEPVSPLLMAAADPTRTSLPAGYRPPPRLFSLRI